MSGEVARLTIEHRNTDAAGQLEDIRNLIAEEVDAIIVNPADGAINAALEEATGAGITVIAVDQAVTAEGAYLLATTRRSTATLAPDGCSRQLGGGQGRLHAWRRRRDRGHRPRHRLPARAGGEPGHRGRGREADRLGPGHRRPADQ